MQIVLALIVGVALVGSGYAVDVPLVVREEAGIARVQSPVNSGVPLPKGAVSQVTELRLVDDRGEVVLASIEPRCRWLGDQSLKWVGVHFMVDLPANGVRHYRLVSSEAGLPETPLRLLQQDKSITVSTGVARFVITTDQLGPFDQVWLGESHGTGTAGLLERPARVVLAGRNGQSRVQEGRAELVGLEEHFEQTAAVHAAEIEESGPGRAVVALKGTFSQETLKSLDFTARLYFYANSALVQMTLTVRNRQLDDMARFVGIEQFALEVPLRNSGKVTSLIDIDGVIVDRLLEGKGLTLLQPARSQLRVVLPDDSEKEGERSTGWVQVRTEEGVLTAGNRWFWQTYPKGVEVRPDGTTVLMLKPEDGERVDLYTAGAKTHFLFFHFAPSEEIGGPSLAAGTQFPLYALANPDWYCQETRVFGELYSENPENFEPRYRDMIGRYQANVDGRLERIVANRSRDDWATAVDEFGWLDFGSGLHHQSRTFATSAESWWDSNYYDFPHAAIINFVRTGNLFNLQTAEEAGLHLADIDICHSFPGNPEYAGSPRSGPVIGHFRNYTRGRLYMGHSSFTFYKNESLYELYYLTGERWYREVGLMSSNFAMARWGQGALRNLAHGIWGVLSAYHDTHDEKYLARARFFVDEWGKPWQDKYSGGFQDQHWMYGLLFEAYGKYFEVTDDEETARYLVRALDALIREFWSEEKGAGFLPGIGVYGFGLGYDYTGDEEYLRKGLLMMELLAKPGVEGDRVKTFAQNFRSSPYFLNYLVQGRKPRVVLGDK